MLAEHEHFAGIVIQVVQFAVQCAGEIHRTLSLAVSAGRGLVRQIHVHRLIEEEHVRRIVIHLDRDDVRLF